MNKILSALVLGVLLFACSNQKKNKIVELTIHHEVLTLDADLFCPSYLKYDNEKIFTYSDCKNIFQVIDLVNSNHVTQFGKTGKGPGEFNFAANFDCYNGEMFIHDNNNNRFYVLNSDSVENIKNATSKRYADLSLFRPRSSVLSNDRIISGGTSENERFAVMDKNGQIVKTFGTFPEEAFIQTKNIKELSMGYETTISNNHKQRKLCAITLFSDLLEIYKENKDSFELEYEHFTFLPRFKKVTAGERWSVVQDDASKYGYVTLSSTPENIYVGINNMSDAENDETEVNGRIKEVLVFDWEGNLHTIYTLDMWVTEIEVNESGTVLYALAEQAETFEPIILKYNLK